MANDEIKREAPAAAADNLKTQTDDMAEYKAADELINDSRKAAKSRSWMWVWVIVALVLAIALFILMVP